MVLDTPQIIETTSQTTAVIHLIVPRHDMRKVFGPAAGELMAALNAQGINPEGALFAHHLRMSDDVFDFELGVRVATPFATIGRVKPSELPATKLARTTYSGPYEGLPAAWGEFTAWIKANGHEQADDLWEAYSIGPQSTPDQAGWRTELNRPLKR